MRFVFRLPRPRPNDGCGHRSSVRHRYGGETVRIILGHRSAAVTEIYAERDEQKAFDAVARIG